MFIGTTGLRRELNPQLKWNIYLTVLLVQGITAVLKFLKS